MKIRLMPRVEDIIPEHIEGSNVIVIDMLRATSVIVTAINSGAKGVIPVLTVEEAIDLRKKMESLVLGGERKGLKIEGFDAGNSPLEYTRGLIAGKTLVITTSNGTRAIKGCNGARNIFIGSMLNGKAAANSAAKDKVDISMVCAGTQGSFSLDDFLCAGYIIDEILKDGEWDLDDISFLAHYTFTLNKDNLKEFIKNARHARYLAEVGFDEDINYCCSRGVIDAAPVYRDGIIKN